MEQITAWAAGLCLCALVCAILEIITPDGSTEKIVRFVLGLFMICAVAVPLVNISLNFEDWAVVAPYKENSQLETEIQNQSLRLVNEALEEQIKTVTARFDTVPIKTEIHTDIDGNNRISIVSVTIVLEHDVAEKSLQIKNAVKTELGLDCNTVIAENKLTGS
ncbi:MAG: stage III sporulation protein AF [Acutalibacteraceae bacterium]